MFEHGSEIIKVDLHTHTKSEISGYREGDKTYSNEEFAKLYVKQMSENNIKITAVTNHNTFNREEYLVLEREAKKHGLLVLPGVEVSLNQRGIHILVIFPSNCVERNIVDNTCAVERFVSCMYPGGSFELDNTPKRASNFEEMKDILEDKIKVPYMLMPAHVDSDKGMIQELKYGNYKQYITPEWMRKRIMAFQDIKEDSRKKYFDQIHSIARENFWNEATLIPAFISASDAKSIGEIGNRYTEIKLGELSFDALYFALTQHELRIVSEETSYPFIKGIEFNSTKGLKGVKVPLNKNLNTFIGVRGSGKSTIIEALRYTFDIKAESDREYKNNLLDALLGPGNDIIVDVIDKTGAEYRIKRSFGDYPAVYEKDDHKSGLKPLMLVPLVYYGQKDLQEMVSDISRMVKFLDVYIQEPLDGMKRTENIIKEQLKDMYRSIEQIESKISRQREYEEKRALAIKIIDDFKRKKIANKLKVEADFKKDKIRLEQFVNLISDMGKNISGFKDEIISVLNFSIDMSGSSNKDIFLKLSECKREFEIESDKSFAVMDHAHKKLTSDVKSISEEFDKRMFEIKGKIAEIKRDIDAKEVSLDDYPKNVGIKEKMDIFLNEIKRYNEQKQVLIEKKAKIFEELKNIWHTQFKKRQSMAESINGKQDIVRIDVRYKGDKEQFSEFLKELLTGSRINERDRKKIAELMDDGMQLVDAIKQPENELIKEFSETSYGKLKQYCEENEYELTTFRVPDTINIYYEGKDINKLSLGQRASALMMLIMEMSDMPLIVDQPEDDLDNQMIYEGLVKELWKHKGKRQIIFATHNSNIPVLGDCEQGIVCSMEDGQITVQTGSIDKDDLRKSIVEIMEGGKEAFDKRKEVYEKWI